MGTDINNDDEPALHAHAHAPSSAVAASPVAKVVAGIILVLSAVFTVVGLVNLWPDYAEAGRIAQQTDYAVPGATYEQGEIAGLFEDCQVSGGAGSCVSVELSTGPDAGELIDVELKGSLANSGLRVGDEIELVHYPEFMPSTDAESQYEISWNYEATGIVRHLPLLVLTIVFAAVVVAVGRLRGALALLALGVSGGVVIGFILPALLTGQPAVLVGLVGSSAILFVILYFVHGPNLRTTAALIGTLCGIAMMALLSTVAVHTARLSGLGSESSGWLSAMTTNIDFRGLLVCAIIIAGLGILNDVTITQASAVWELRAAAPHMDSREIYRRAMRIGRDHIASTVYTVFFAYVGAALSVLMLLYIYDRPVLSILTEEDIAIEIVSTLCGSIGLVLAVPITTWVAALLVQPSTSVVRSPAR